MAKETQGFRNEVYTPVFDVLLKRHGAPADDLGISPNLFIRAQRAIVNRAHIDRQEGPMLKGSGVDLPVRMFTVFYEETARTFSSRLGLDIPTAEGLAAALEREAVELAGIDYSSYLGAVEATRPDPAALGSALRGALKTLYNSSIIDNGFEVPYVAGYDKDQPSYILIDCAVPLGPTLDGRFVPVAKLLNIHERVEKALLDEYGIKYQSAHQVALRVEKAASDASGINWKIYDDLITNIADRIASRTPKRISNQLDLQPYYSFTDPDNVKLVEGMNSAIVDQPAFARPIDKSSIKDRTGVCPK
jgi:hypothetical protein